MNSLPIVGIVVTISPSFSLYKMVVFPAASRPTKKKGFHQFQPNKRVQKLERRKLQKQVIVVYHLPKLQLQFFSSYNNKPYYATSMITPETRIKEI